MQNNTESIIGYEELLQIMNRGPAVSIIWRNIPDMHIDFISENVEKITGFSSQDIISGKVTFDQIYHPDDMERVRIKRQEIIVDTNCDEYEQESYRIITRDGELKWVSSQTFIQRDKTGQVIHYRTMLLDITDQKEHAANTFNAISDAIILYPFSEEDKAFIEVNDAACTLYGYTREELLNLNVKNITDIAHYENQDVLNFRKSLKDKKNIIFETVHKSKSGKSFPVEINTSLINHLGQRVILSVVRDITERKEIEESLRISKYSLDKAAIGAFCLNPAGEIYNVNDEAARMLGYTKEELESLCLFDIDPMVTAENYDEIWQILIDNGANFFESFHRKKDGTTIPVEIYANILEYEGKIFSISFSKDISKRKMAEKALQDNLVQLQAIYNNLPVALWATDKKGVFTLSEGMALSKLNLLPGQIVGISAYDAFKMYSDILENFKRAHHGEICEFETEIQGNIFQSIMTPIIDENGDCQGTNGIAIDITEKRKVEEELQNLKNYLTNIINSMPSTLIGVDSSGCITQWNKTAEKCTGISSDEAFGKKLSILLPQMEPEMEKIKKSIIEGQIVQEHKRSVTIDKNATFEEMTIYPLLTNSAGGAVIRIDNVTEKIRLEEMIIQSEKMLSVGGLAAGMAHEINNPLAGMIQTISVLSNRLCNNPEIIENHKVAEKLGINMDVIEKYMEGRGINTMIDIIMDSGKRIADIVENMLSFSRKSDEFVSSHDLGDLLEKTLTLAMTDYNLKKNWDFRKIKITKEYDNESKIVPCEKVKIQQVLLNLLKNGAQAMQGAGIKNPEYIIRIYTDSFRDMVFIEIEDNGPGMDSDTCKRVFEPFFTTKAIGEGTGLGLSVSYFIIVENHKGIMEVQSKLGSGTTFTIGLPKKRTNMNTLG